MGGNWNTESECDEMGEKARWTTHWCPQLELSCDLYGTPGKCLVHDQRDGKLEERSEVREEGAEGAVRDGVVLGRPPPPPPGFGVRDSVVCESLSLSCARAVRTVICTTRVGVLRACL